MLSMVASKDDESPANVLEIEGQPDLRVLRTAAIFGANASGKSNLIRALYFMREYVLESTRERVRPGERVRQPFRLDARVLSQPSQFEVTVVLGGVKHTYGFALNDQGVAQEWWHTHAGRRRRLFERAGDQPVKWGESWAGERKRLQERTRRDALLLSAASEFNHELARALVAWFRDLVVMPAGAVGPSAFELQPLLALCHADESLRSDIVRHLSAVDGGIARMEIAKSDMANSRVLSAIMPPSGAARSAFSSMEWFEATTRRVARGPAGEPTEVAFDLEDESDGTQRFMVVLSPMAQGIDGRTVVADELDTRLHPLLLRYIVNSITGGRGQMIFTTHTTDLLGAKRDNGEALLRRDQIWLTEKDGDGASRLFSLWDIRGVRRTEDVRERYLRGLYGGVPRIPLLPGEAIRERE